MQTAEIKTKAIVARAVPYGESDMIVTLVGVDTGTVTATARGCLRRGAKLRYAAEPFNFGDYVLVGRNGRYVITECSQIDSFNAVTRDLQSYYAAFMVLDALTKLCAEPQPSIMLAALKTLQRLAYTTDETDCAVTDFLLAALEESGNRLDFKHCNICKCQLDEEAYFNAADGIVCKHCKSIDAVPVDAACRAYIAGERGETSHALRVKANILLSEFVYSMSGVRINPRYFTEQI